MIEKMKRIVKLILRGHSNIGLSTQDSLERILEKDNDLTRMFLVLASDYPSQEDCITALTAEAILEDEFVDATPKKISSKVKIETVKDTKI